MVKKWINDQYRAILFFIAVISFWQFIPHIINIHEFILPTPKNIIIALWNEKGILLFIHLPITLMEALVGLIISILLGFLIAWMMHRSIKIEKTIYPFIIISQTIPFIVLSPIIIMWFGYGIWAKTFIIVLISFFPISINIFYGLKAVDISLRNLFESYGATKKQLFWKLEIPSAMPYILTGIKMAATISVVGATIGEWLGSDAGLGYYSRRMTSNLRADSSFAAVVLLALLGLGLNGVIHFIEQKWFKNYLTK